jgi:hypothetical protein
VKLLGILIAALGAALTIYAIPPASFVAIGAILVGVFAMVIGVRMIRRTGSARSGMPEA